MIVLLSGISVCILSYIIHLFFLDCFPVRQCTTISCVPCLLAVIMALDINYCFSHLIYRFFCFLGLSYSPSIVSILQLPIVAFGQVHTDCVFLFIHSSLLSRFPFQIRRSLDTFNMTFSLQGLAFSRRIPKKWQDIFDLYRSEALLRRSGTRKPLPKVA